MLLMDTIHFIPTLPALIILQMATAHSVTILPVLIILPTELRQFFSTPRVLTMPQADLSHSTPIMKATMRPLAPLRFAILPLRKAIRRLDTMREQITIMATTMFFLEQILARMLTTITTA